MPGPSYLDTTDDPIENLENMLSSETGNDLKGPPRSRVFIIKPCEGYDYQLIALSRIDIRKYVTSTNTGDHNFLSDQGELSNNRLQNTTL